MTRRIDVLQPHELTSSSEALSEPSEQTTPKSPITVADLPQILTSGRIAKLLGVAPRTVCQWCDQGLLRCHTLPGSKRRRVLPKDFLTFVRYHGMEESLAQMRRD